jgi:hypothetical protein
MDNMPNIPPVLLVATLVRRLRWRSAATETRHEITARPGSSARRQFASPLTDAAYDAIASTLPKGTARWPMERDQGQCFIQVEAAVVDRMRAMRRPGESYSQVILRLVDLETSDPK